MKYKISFIRGSALVAVLLCVSERARVCVCVYLKSLVIR